MSSRPATLAAVLALCACGRSEAPPTAAAAPSRLGAALKTVGSSPACRTQIPSTWSSSLPVPDAGGREFKVFFFLVEAGADRKGMVSGPAGEARFDLEGNVSACRRLPAPAKKIGPSLNPALAGLTIKEIDARQEEFLARLESAAAVYARRGRLGSGASDLSGRFEQLREPPLAEAYRGLNPDFWSWLDAPP